jgi:hypothetical protein
LLLLGLLASPISPTLEAAGPMLVVLGFMLLLGGACERSWRADGVSSAERHDQPALVGPAAVAPGTGEQIAVAREMTASSFGRLTPAERDATMLWFRRKGLDSDAVRSVRVLDSGTIEVDLLLRDESGSFYAVDGNGRRVAQADRVAHVDELRPARETVIVKVSPDDPLPHFAEDLAE